MTAVRPSDATRARTIRRLLVVGVVLLVPRLVLVWFLLQDPGGLLVLITTFVFVAGLFCIGAALIRRQMLRGSRLLWTGLVGVALILVAGAIVQAFPAGGQSVAYEGGLVTPLPVAVYNYAYLALGAASQLGLVLAVGSFASAVGRRLSRGR